MLSAEAPETSDSPLQCLGCEAAWVSPVCLLQLFLFLVFIQSVWELIVKTAIGDALLESKRPSYQYLFEERWQSLVEGKDEVSRYFRVAPNEAETLSQMAEAWRRKIQGTQERDSVQYSAQKWYPSAEQTVVQIAARVGAEFVAGPSTFVFKRDGDDISVIRVINGSWSSDKEQATARSRWTRDSFTFDLLFWAVVSLIVILPLRIATTWRRKKLKQELRQLHEKARLIQQSIEQVQSLSVGEAKQRVVPLLSNSRLFRCVEKPIEDAYPIESLPPLLRELFSKYESICAIDEDMTISRNGIEPSEIDKRFTRIGERPDGLELCVIPGSEVIYLLERDVPLGELEQDTSPTIYHWLLEADD